MLKPSVFDEWRDQDIGRVKVQIFEEAAGTAFNQEHSLCIFRPAEIFPLSKNRFLETPDKEPGLNYLCAGYRRFFTHCQPFVSEVAALWRRQNLE